MFSKKIILPFLFLSFITPSVGHGQTFRDAHRQAHTKQLANAKSAIDKSVISDFIKNEVAQREEIEVASHTLSAEMSLLVSDLLSEAKNHLGDRYRSGGKGPHAFDCSGFSSYIFKQFGYNLGASSRDQYKQGESVSIDKIQPGDLVFFTGRNSKSGIVGHVGIVVTSDNANKSFTFIHAANKGGIRIDSNVGYYSHRYIGAKRIITD